MHCEMPRRDDGGLLNSSTAPAPARCIASLNYNLILRLNAGDRYCVGYGAILPPVSIKIYSSYLLARHYCYELDCFHNGTQLFYDAILTRINSASMTRPLITTSIARSFQSRFLDHGSITGKANMPASQRQKNLNRQRQRNKKKKKKNYAAHRDVDAGSGGPRIPLTGVGNFATSRGARPSRFSVA